MIRKECLRMSNKRALISAAASIVPLPFTDIATDIMVLRDVIPRITRQFGLAKEQIDRYDPQIAIMIYEVAKELGSKIIGRYLTKEVILYILKKMGIRSLTTKQVAHYIPLIGQAVSAGISYTGMTIIIRHHIKECYEVAGLVMDRSRALNPGAVAPVDKT
ncbi:MAG: hypothetical protein ACYDHW_07630 [Syntrophorhabdaceae bacterium]